MMAWSSLLRWCALVLLGVSLTGCRACSDDAIETGCGNDGTLCADGLPKVPDDSAPTITTPADDDADGGDAAGGETPPVPCLGVDATMVSSELAGPCGGVVDATLEFGLLVDNAVEPGGDGSFAHPFSTLETAVAAVKAAHAAGSTQTKLYLVRRDVPYVYAAPTNDSIKFPFELYGGFIPLGPDQYTRQLDVPSVVEFPNGLLMGALPLRLDGVAVTTQRIRALNTPITIAWSQLTSYPENTDAELLRYIVWYQANGQLTITDSRVFHAGSLSDHLIALDVNALGNTTITIARSSISSGDTTGASYGVRLYRPIAQVTPTFAVTISDSTIAAGAGIGSVALLCGEKGDDLSIKFGKGYGIGTVRVERSTVQAGGATLHRSLGVGLYNATGLSVLRNNVIIGGVWDADAPPVLATAIELLHSNIALVNNTLRDGDFMLAIQKPVAESLTVQNNIIAPWESGWGVVVDPNGPGSAQFLFTDLSHNLFATSDSALGYSLFYHPKTGVLWCQQTSCVEQSATLNQSGVFVTGGGNLMTAAQFTDDGLHVATGSPAIDAGIPSTQFEGETDADLTTDHDGHPRDATPDIGAFEWGE